MKTNCNGFSQQSVKKKTSPEYQYTEKFKIYTDVIIPTYEGMKNVYAAGNSISHTTYTTTKCTALLDILRVRNSKGTRGMGKFYPSPKMTNPNQTSIFLKI